MRRLRNSKGGTSMAEIGPALFVLVIVILIPICDLLALFCSYTAGWLLNSTVARECACHDPNVVTDVTKAIQIADGAWKNNILIVGLAQAKNATTTHKIVYTRQDNGVLTAKFPATLTVSGSGTVTGSPATPTYIGAAPAPALPNSTSYIARCSVATTLPVSPLFVVPFIGNVPGLSAPITFTYYAERPQEEKGMK